MEVLCDLVLYLTLLFVPFAAVFGIISIPPVSRFVDRIMQKLGW